MLLCEKGVVNGIMLRFFVTRANCFCLLHFSHRWLSAFVWPPAGYEWNVWRDEPVFTGCLLLLFVVTSVLLFLVSGFYAYTTNTGEIKKECTILILFLHFHMLPGAFGEKPYTLVLRMWLWISCVHRLFYMSFFFLPFQRVWICAAHLLVGSCLFYSLFEEWTDDVLQSHAKKETNNYGKRNLMKQMYVRRQARESWFVPYCSRFADLSL